MGRWLALGTEIARPVRRRSLAQPEHRDGENAELAQEYGADDIGISNHGGRMENSLRSSVECVPEVAAGVAGRAPTIVDGASAAAPTSKALVPGATVVCVGRQVFGLPAFGQPGVDGALDLVDSELRMDTYQAGAPASGASRRPTSRPPNGGLVGSAGDSVERLDDGRRAAGSLSRGRRHGLLLVGRQVAGPEPAAPRPRGGRLRRTLTGHAVGLASAWLQDRADAALAHPLGDGHVAHPRRRRTRIHAVPAPTGPELDSLTRRGGRHRLDSVIARMSCVFHFADVSDMGHLVPSYRAGDAVSR